jgi:hypothetical protein
MKKRKKRSNTTPGSQNIVQISKGVWKKALRNRRCEWIGGDEGGSTHKCGKKILVHDHVNDEYYRVTGAHAMYVAYQEKQFKSRGRR